MMQAPEWLKPGIWGAVVGGVATAVIGFSWAGWTTAGTAQQMSERHAESAVTAALVPFCVALAEQDPDPAKLTQLIAERPGYSSRQLVAGFGWATMPGVEAPNTALATACAAELHAKAG